MTIYFLLDYNECKLDTPCHTHAKCIIVPQNFNYGCQCIIPHYHGNGFHCSYGRDKTCSSQVDGLIKKQTFVRRLEHTVYLLKF